MPQIRRLPTWLLALIVPVVAAVAVIVTLTTTSTSSISATSGPVDGTAITIKDFAFSPRALRVPAGQAIKVSNTDGTAHTVTADGKSFDTGDIDGGTTATITIDKPGKYKYFCNIHNYMTGTIEAT